MDEAAVQQRAVEKHAFARLNGRLQREESATKATLQAAAAAMKVASAAGSEQAVAAITTRSLALQAKLGAMQDLLKKRGAEEKAAVTTEEQEMIHLQKEDKSNVLGMLSQQTKRQAHAIDAENNELDAIKLSQQRMQTERAGDLTQAKAARSAAVEASRSEEDHLTKVEAEVESLKTLITTTQQKAAQTQEEQKKDGQLVDMRNRLRLLQQHQQQQQQSFDEKLAKGTAQLAARQAAATRRNQRSEKDNNEMRKLQTMQQQLLTKITRLSEGQKTDGNHESGGEASKTQTMVELMVKHEQAADRRREKVIRT
jgi:hypothetical protein